MKLHMKYQGDKSVFRQALPIPGRLIRHDGMTVQLLALDGRINHWRALVRRADPEGTVKAGDYVYVPADEVPPEKSL